LNNLFLCLFFMVCLNKIEFSSAAEDQRCRCVCPRLKTLKLNSSQLVIDGVDYTNKSVYVRNNVDPEACDCEQTLNYILPPKTVSNISDIDKFCLRCECKFEQRNSTTQKVVIIFVIVVFGLMFIYALFLMCLDPIMNKRRTYRRTVDDMAEELPAHEPSPGTSGSQASRRVSAAVSRVRAEQQKWKGQVSNQRSNIYTKHKMLA